MKGTLIIKKHKSRRLYDTENSRYLSKEDLIKLIRNGRNIQVQEAGSNEDITVETLLQLVISDNSIPLSTDFLHFLIRANHGVLTSLFRDFLPSFLPHFQKNHQSFQSGFGSFFNTNQAMQSMLNPWLPAMGGVGVAGFSGGTAGSAEEEIKELRQKMAELEKRLQEDADSAKK